jgi:hypothetical protein
VKAHIRVEECVVDGVTDDAGVRHCNMEVSILQTPHRRIAANFSLRKYNQSPSLYFATYSEYALNEYLRFRTIVLKHVPYASCSPCIR